MRTFIHSEGKLTSVVTGPSATVTHCVVCGSGRALRAQARQSLVSLRAPGRLSVDSGLRFVLLDGAEELVEVPFPKATAAAELLPAVLRHAAYALNDLQEDGRAVAHWLGEDLKQHTLVVAIGKEAEFFALGELVFCEGALAEAGRQRLVVLLTGSVHELKTTSTLERAAHSSHCVEDVVSLEGDVLDPRAAVLVQVGLDLGLALATRGGLVDWEEHEFIVGCKHHGV
mmetsp:Transcript_28776/g.77465  ORF Transcript_28776/g.77465 Transcript_28776/m.77465 type:complete len:228 (-) Transcript_28776:860-1543(-)